MEYLKGFIGFVILLVVVIVGFILLMIAIITPFMWIQCKNYTNITGTETKFSIIQGECFLKMQGKWIPYEKWVNISGEVK